MNTLRSLQAFSVLFFAGASLASAQSADPSRPLPALDSASEDGAETARAAVRRVRSGAPEAIVRIESMPEEFAPVLRVMAYAGEDVRGMESDAAAALACKAAYWGRQKAALRRGAAAEARLVDAVLADIKADQAGADSGQALIARKAALMRRAARL